MRIPMVLFSPSPSATLVDLIEILQDTMQPAD